MEYRSAQHSIPTATQGVALWVAGAFISLACFGVARMSIGTEGLLFGVFHVSVVGAILQLALGATALVMAGSARHCRAFLAGAGLLMVILLTYGQLDPAPVIADLVPIGPADVWLHVVLAVAMLAGAALPVRIRWRRPKMRPAVTGENGRTAS
ncbi:DUF4383 domain-containing protein [Kribbella pittospori]|uniref:DUF4383 domain-containing protein n=1 Tax=Kribbella pittospori TaxID=722689 RepID=A0A4R0KXP6_9ACTN|nr:DUF4383 domain-containing protein [Kribbella pittospori]TCC64086.1 DUF4383 domain-containing protein [Kribbella pittospori]